MQKRSLSDAKLFDVTHPSRIGHTALNLQGEETGLKEFRVTVSYYMPGGYARWEASPKEKVFLMLEGELTFKTKTEEVTLRPWDSVSLAANEGREIANNTNRPATMIVVAGL